MLFDGLFSPAAIGANWTENVSNRIPYLGEGLFPARKQAGLDLKWIKGSKGIPVSLMPSAFDAKATFRDRIGVEKVETEMPFSPIGDSGPLGYVSGAFLGDGGEFSDQLFRYDASTGETTNAVWSASAWLDPFTWLPSFMQAFPGDSLSLLRADSEPFSFCLFGRASGIAYRTGAPRFRSMAVDPAGEFADFSVFTRGLTTDLFLSDFATNHGDASSWFHVGRYPGHSILFDWRDAALPTSGGRVYLAADATRDSDGDGLPDEMERRVASLRDFAISRRHRRRWSLRLPRARVGFRSTRGRRYASNVPVFRAFRAAGRGCRSH